MEARAAAAAIGLLAARGVSVCSLIHDGMVIDLAALGTEVAALSRVPWL